MTFATAVGSLPAAVIYALAGAASMRLEQGFLVFAGVVLLAVPTWMIGTRVAPRVFAACLPAGGRIERRRRRAP